MSQVILITGATSGIGRAAALHLAREGHHVIATGRRQAALHALVAEAVGLQLSAVRMDVTDDASIADAVAVVDALTNGHSVDVIINNAGYGQVGAVLDVSPEDVRKQYNTNVFGVLAVTQAFTPAMMARGRGRVINISSLGGLLTLPLLGVYSSTKFALESLSDALRMELAPFGVAVSVVEPGSIATEFSDVALGTVDREGALTSSPWAPVYEVSARIEERFADYASSPEVITRVLSTIIRSSRPRARYAAPFRDAFSVILATYLPTFLVDRVLSRLFGLHHLSLPAAPSVRKAA